MRIRLALACLAYASLAAAQDLDSALVAVNEAFGGSVQVKLDRRQQLVFDLFDANGRYRQDIILPTDLDTASVHFSVEEDATILACRADRPQCIGKEIFKMNTVRRTGRSNLPRPANDEGGVRTSAALKQLIAAASAALLAAAPETHSRPQRMK